MLIALTAQKGSGKDLIADYIVKKFKFNKLAYADHLKEILRLIFGFSEKELFGSQQNKEEINEKWGISSRQAALAFGDFMRYTLPEKHQEYKEKIGSGYFVNYLTNKINTNKNYVISDVRFNNEIIELRKELPNETILLIRINRTRQGFNTETDSHHSEDTKNINPKEINLIIENNTTIEELYSKIDNIMINYKEKFS